MSHEVVWEPGGVLRHFWGVLRAAEYAHVQADAYANSRFDNLRYILVDFSEVSEFIATVAEAEEIIASTNGAYLSNPKLRVAVVTTHEKLRALLAEVNDLSAYPLRLFQTVAEAREWLSTPTPIPAFSRAARF